MTQLTIELSDVAYQELVQQSVATHKSPEAFVTEHLESVFGERIRTAEHALQKAQDFVAPWAGRLFHLCSAHLNPDQSIWNVPLLIQKPDAALEQVGTVEIEAKTGAVSTGYDEVKAIIRKVQQSVGMSTIPKKKQVRLSELLDRGNRGKLTMQQQQELDELIEEADAQTTENLKRLANLCPPT